MDGTHLAAGTVKGEGSTGGGGGRIWQKFSGLQKWKVGVSSGN